jgi:hypothetical protein
MVAHLSNKFLALQGNRMFVKWELAGHALGKRSGVKLDRYLLGSRSEVDEKEKHAEQE